MDNQPNRARLITAIDDLLPQTQCGQCDYAGCLPYAEAIAKGEAAINQCPPGGDANIQRLATLTGQPYQPLNPKHGISKPPQVAVIIEPDCIGCTLCIQACPVDAIVGAAKQMHTIIGALCTGCELCLPPCPVECIALEPVSGPADECAARDFAHAARARYQRRQQRLQREQQARATRNAQAKATPAAPGKHLDVNARQAALAAASERARQKRAAHHANTKAVP